MSEGYDGLPAYYSQSSDPLTPNVGFSLKGMDPIVAENFVLADTAIGGGGGTSVKVNGSTISNPNFNGTTPAAPGGNTNVIWQTSGSSVSAYVPTATFPATKTLYVDGTRTDIYTQTGSITSPFKTIMGAVNQVITNGDNATYTYLIDIQPFTYVETVDIGNASIVSIMFEGHGAAGAAFASAGSPMPGAVINPASGNSFQALTNVDQIALLQLSGITFSKSVQITDTTGANLGANGFAFSNCSFNKSVTVSALSGFIPLQFISSSIANNGNTLSLTHCVVNWLDSDMNSGTCHLVSTILSLASWAFNPAVFTIDAGSTVVGQDGINIGQLSTPISVSGTMILNFCQVLTGITVNLGGTLVNNGALLSSPVTNNGTYTLAGTGNTFGTDIINAGTGFQVNGAATLGNYLRGNGTNFVSSPIAAGDVTWDKIGNAAGNLTLANAGFSSTFNQTSAVPWTWANTTAAANAGFPTPGLGAVNAASVGQAVTSLSININAGDCVVVFSANAGGGNPVITDNAAGGSNVYTQIGGQLTSWGFENVYVSLNSKAATTITITFGGTIYTTSAATFVSVGAVGAFTSAANGTAGTATATVTTTANLSLVIGGLFCNHTSTLAATSGSAITAISSTTVATSVQTLQVSSSGSSGTISASVTPNAQCGAFVIELLSGITNQSSPVLNLAGKYWTGTSSVTDSWSVQPVMSGGSNPTSTLTFLHSGSSGVAAVSFPAFTSILSYGNIVEQNTTVATATSTNASPTFQLSANYWTGAASAADTWTIGSSLASGTNGASTLAITHAGSTGQAVVTFPIGASGKPSIAFAGAATTGFWETSSAVVVTGGGTNVCAFASGLARLSSGGVYQWSSGDTGASAGDTGISRVSAGLIAIGNGTGGNATGNLMLGLITKYNGVNTVNGGVPAELANADLTAQTAAIAANTIYVPVATGMYRVSWSATITTAGTSSSLGGTNGFQVIYTSPTDSVVKTTIVDATSISAANTTGTAVGGCLVVYAKTSTNLQYKFDYTSTGTAMQYELHVKVEAL